MAWITLTETEVATRLAGAEVTALKTVALSAGQANPLPEIISQVIGEVRGYCANHNTLAAGETIPSKLVSATLAIIRARLITRLPLKMTEDRKDELKQAIALLNLVAKGDFKIEEPLVEDTEVTAGTTSVVNARTRVASVEDQDGL